MSGIINSAGSKSGIIGAIGTGQIIRVISYAPTTVVTQTTSSSNWATFSLTAANLSGASKVLMTWEHQFTINVGASHGYCSLNAYKGGSSYNGVGYVQGYNGAVPSGFYDTVGGQLYDDSPDLTGQDYVWNVLPQYCASVVVQDMNAIAFIIE